MWNTIPISPHHQGNISELKARLLSLPKSFTLITHQHKKSTNPPNNPNHFTLVVAPCYIFRSNPSLTIMISLRCRHCIQLACSSNNICSRTSQMSTLKEHSMSQWRTCSNNNNNNGRNGSFLHGWLPHRGKAQVACNIMLPYEDNIQNIPMRKPYQWPGWTKNEF